ncbi:hypothetical protein RHMOL_Rhmol04G0178900 [Rhododendron molle]|uniref:Uncharacterized protein n=1 Tax=Rhododendron molle TaxID=49168 RepID=A0ACC0P3F5_RHOML|nr:hypothetical protein RHMOL_Rhmol04G0178900 [Rhododendron molle]
MKVEAILEILESFGIDGSVDEMMIGTRGYMFFRENWIRLAMEIQDGKGSHTLLQHTLFILTHNHNSTGYDQLETMASKRNPTHVANGEEYSWTQPLQEISVGVAFDEHCANIVNNDTRMADTIAQTRQKSSYADKGKGLLTYAKEKETSLVEPLRERNVGVAIHEERNMNVMRIREVRTANTIYLEIMKVTTKHR